jgi:type II secretory ATPase GspE/PulE/Tfp pilus assembly ATPase PilB-like protein
MPPISGIVENLILQALQQKASDIHLEPEERSLNVRYRVDGILRPQPPLSKELSAQLVSHLKAAAGLDTAGCATPQDGSFRMDAGGSEVELTISTCPTIHGENTVLKIRERKNPLPPLDSLGFPPRTLAMFKELLGSPCGITLITGPAGNGTTATLYSSLQFLNHQGISIMTVEERVEYRFPGMRQVQAGGGTGLTHGAVIRSFLRQDPDIIMAGEMRDRETAEACIEAALTGRRVFSTLHAGDSVSALARLTAMGIEPFLVSSSFLCIIAQRLVRRLCDGCGRPYKPGRELLREMRLRPAAGRTFFRAAGCPQCGGTGFRGRTGIFELFRVTPAIQQLILRNATPDALRAAAAQEKFRTLRQSCLDAVMRGATTAEEFIRVGCDTA